MITPAEFNEGQYILINKPLGWTSFDVVAKIRGPLQKYCQNKKIKIGHAGTLDPLATGLLVLVTGKFTKRAEELQMLGKEYTGAITLGANTPSYDAETEVSETFPLDDMTDEKIINATKQFTGIIEQVPPVYSSVKVQGRRAYSYARKGEQLILKPRTLTIYSFDIIKTELPIVYFKINCSKGTYIRAIANDLGAALGCGGYLSSLCRTRIGDFDVKDAMSPEDFISSLRQSI
ncbi:MAG: tRNA pseudouridine(55) synthase TruB [Chitinophagales bacterium]